MKCSFASDLMLKSWTRIIWSSVSEIGCSPGSSLILVVCTWRRLLLLVICLRFPPPSNLCLLHFLMKDYSSQQGCLWELFNPYVNKDFLLCRPPSLSGAELNLQHGAGLIQSFLWQQHLHHPLHRLWMSACVQRVEEGDVLHFFSNCFISHRTSFTLTTCTEKSDSLVPSCWFDCISLWVLCGGKREL